MTKFIPDVLEAFINGLGYVADVWEAVYSAPNTTITVGNVLHLRAGLTVSIDGAGAEIISVDYGANSFVVSGDFSSASLVTFPTPFFFHGTPLATNSHISRLKDDSMVPMVYLYEVIRENLGGPNSRMIESSLRLFFLDVSNFQDWDTDEHYSLAIRPMRNLADYFIWSAKKQVGKMQAGDRSEIITHAKFGAVNNKGHFQSIFNVHLSGVEVSIDLVFTDCSPYKGINPPKPTALKSSIDTAEGLGSELQLELIG